MGHGDNAQARRGATGCGRQVAGRLLAEANRGADGLRCGRVAFAKTFGSVDDDLKRAPGRDPNRASAAKRPPEPDAPAPSGSLNAVAHHMPPDLREAGVP